MKLACCHPCVSDGVASATSSQLNLCSTHTDRRDDATLLLSCVLGTWQRALLFLSSLSLLFNNPHVQYQMLTRFFVHFEANSSNVPLSLVQIANTFVRARLFKPMLAGKSVT